MNPGPPSPAIWDPLECTPPPLRASRKTCSPCVESKIPFTNLFTIIDADLSLLFVWDPRTMDLERRTSTSRKRVLVTGGAGFIGSHLCERLLARGDDVLCIDNFFTGVKGNISHLFGNPYFEFLRHDVTFPLYVEIDEIYNLACPASPIHYQFDPVQTTKTSVHGA